MDLLQILSKDKFDKNWHLKYVAQHFFVTQSFAMSVSFDKTNLFRHF